MAAASVPIGGDSHFKAIRVDSPYLKKASMLPFIGAIPCSLSMISLYFECKAEKKLERSIKLLEISNEFNDASSISILLGLALRVILVATKNISKKWVGRLGEELAFTGAFLAWNVYSTYQNNKQIEFLRSKCDFK